MPGHMPFDSLKCKLGVRVWACMEDQILTPIEVNALYRLHKDSRYLVVVSWHRRGRNGTKICISLPAPPLSVELFENFPITAERKVSTHLILNT